MSKKLKKELQDQLEICEYKINAELDFVRKELQPLRKQKQQLLERLSEL